MVIRRAPSLVAAFAVAVVLVPSGAAWSAGADPAAPARDTSSLRAAVRSLPVATEVRAGYDRDKFTHWIGQGGGCDTRDRVLISEATRRPRVGDDCALSGGRWYSYYDRVTTTDPSSLDIDHMVPLAEAWDSGARRWNANTRERFANDLADHRMLVAVTAGSNRSKSDQDPAEWMPAAQKCRYIKEYVAAKVRWSLTANRAEKQFLSRQSAACPATTLRVTRAHIGRSR